MQQNGDAGFGYSVTSVWLAAARKELEHRLPVVMVPRQEERARQQRIPAYT